MFHGGRYTGSGSEEKEDDGFNKLIQLRQAAVSAERVESDAIAQIQAVARQAAGRPQWTAKRPVPQLDRGLRSPTNSARIDPSVRKPPQHASTTGQAVAKSSVISGTGSDNARVASAASVPSVRPSGTTSGWGDLKAPGSPIAATTRMSSEAAHYASAVIHSTSNSRQWDRPPSTASSQEPEPSSRASANIAISNATVLSARSAGVSPALPLCAEGPGHTARPVSSAAASLAPRPPPLSRLSVSVKRPQVSPVSHQPARASLGLDAHQGSNKIRGATSAKRSGPTRLRQSGPERDRITNSDLEALRQVSLAEDEDIIQQLTSQSPSRPHSRSSGATKGNLPKVPKVSEVPPSLRAWRQHRNQEGAHDVGSGKEENKKQAARMKNSLIELTDEIRLLQDLMEQDAVELAENVQQIRTELRIARSKRGCGTPSTASAFSIAGSEPSSAASSMPSTPLGSRGAPAAQEIRAAMLRAAAESCSSRTESETMQTTLARLPVHDMRPLPVWILNRLIFNFDGHSKEAVPGLAAALGCFRQFGLQLAEYQSGVKSLALGSVCRAAAAALHTSTGQRLWPHLEVTIGGCHPREVVRTMRAAILWQALCSVSLFGATDESTAELFSSLDLAGSGSNACDIKTLRLRCSSKGSAGAIQKRNQYGDDMGIGDSGFRALAQYLPRLATSRSLRVLDLAWNHLGSGAMAALKANWPEKLETLNLDWNSLEEDGAKYLAQAIVLPCAANLRELHLRSNSLGDAGVIAVCRATAECVGLRWLGIGETSLTDAGAQAALPSLRHHPTLMGLDLGENLLTDISCGAVADVIAGVPQLQKLILRGFLFEPKRVTDTGGQILARAVVRRCSVGPADCASRFSLDLDYQQVGCGTAAEMAKCFGLWSRLSLFNTDVSTMGAMALANAFRQQPGRAGTVQLNIAQCRVGKGAVKLLREVGFLRLDSHGQRGLLQTAVS